MAANFSTTESKYIGLFLACEYSRLSLAPTTTCETRNAKLAGSDERRLYSQASPFPNARISLTYMTYRGSVFLLINEKISDKLWESALADPFQFTIYSRQKASLSRYGAREVHRIIKLCTFADLRRPINLTDLFRFTTHDLLFLVYFLSYLSTEALPFLSWTSLNSIGSFSPCHSHLWRDAWRVFLLSEACKSKSAFHTCDVASRDVPKSERFQNGRQIGVKENS